MTETSHSVVHVHLESSSVDLTPKPDPKTVHTTAKTLNFTGLTGAVQVHNALGHAPNRKHAIITIIGQSVDVVYICTSKADALALSGAPAMGGPYPFELFGSDEIWVGAAAATSVLVGVIAEFTDK